VTGPDEDGRDFDENRVPKGSRRLSSFSNSPTGRILFLQGNFGHGLFGVGKKQGYRHSSCRWAFVPRVQRSLRATCAGITLAFASRRTHSSSGLKKQINVTRDIRERFKKKISWSGSSSASSRQVDVRAQWNYYSRRCGRPSAFANLPHHARRTAIRRLAGHAQLSDCNNSGKVSDKLAQRGPPHSSQGQPITIQEQDDFRGYPYVPPVLLGN